MIPSELEWKPCLCRILHFPFNLRLIVIEPPKSLGPPTVVLVHRTSDNPVDAPNHLTSSVSELFTLPKSVSPVTQILQHIGGTNMRKQLQQLIERVLLLQTSNI
jgi:hypothetical protein